MPNLDSNIRCYIENSNDVFRGKTDNNFYKSSFRSCMEDPNLDSDKKLGFCCSQIACDDREWVDSRCKNSEKSTGPKFGNIESFMSRGSKNSFGIGIL